MQTQTTSVYQLPLDYSGAFFPSRLEWLCQPEQIEYTLLLLYHLNSWKKACKQLLYADRQGLQEIQALVLEYATRMGRVQATAYIDGTARFPGHLLLNSAAENAAKNLLLHLKGLRDPEIWPPFYPDGDRMYKHFIRPLYKRITGQDFKLVADAVEALDLGQLRQYIQDRLNNLLERAKATRQPLSPRRLAALCIEPTNLLPIRDNRLYFLDGYEGWDELAHSDLCKLDPEGYSEISFHYSSSTADFVFHLPFRRAISFLPFTQIQELQKTPGNSQPQGNYLDRIVTEKESIDRPVREILQDLGVDIASVCPHNLMEKEAFLSQASARKVLWSTSDQDENCDEDPWNGACLPPGLL